MNTGGRKRQRIGEGKASVYSQEKPANVCSKDIQDTDLTLYSNNSKTLHLLIHLWQIIYPPLNLILMGLTQFSPLMTD